MSLEVRCNCGWRCQASEYYLGDRIACPDCGAKVPVHARSGIPYGYAPYPTWQKRMSPRAPLRMPQQRRVIFRGEDRHAAAAFWLGLFAVLSTLSGCGVIVGLILAVFGIQQAVRSNAFSRRFARPVQGRARAGLVLSSVAVLLAGVMFFSFFAEAPRKPRTYHPKTPAVQVEHQVEQPVYRYQRSDAAQRALEERLRERMANPDAWRRAADEKGYRYPLKPVEKPEQKPEQKPQQVTPRNEFEQRQIEYSEGVRQQRK